MQRTRCWLAAAFAAACSLSSPIAFSQTNPPTTPDQAFRAWAFPWNPKYPTRLPDSAPQRVPGSSEQFSWAQALDLFVAPDWYPKERPPMPDIVSSGRKPDVRACGSCHRAQGTGGPENASLAGLSESYLIQQLADFKSGARKSSVPEIVGMQLMIASAKGMTDAEVRTASAYFSSIKPARLVKVVETDTVPKSQVARLFHTKDPAGGTEALGRRILEMPDDVDRFELRDAKVTFTAYVPVGSLAKGEALVKGAGGSAPCTTCHGGDLKGAGPIPGLAGRSPSYLARQLYNFKQGTRAGESAALMKPSVEKLDQDEMIALVAYLASLAP